MRSLALALVAPALFASLVFPTVSSAQSGAFSVRPAKVELSGKPGETLTATISLSNTLGAPTTFALSFEDIEGTDLSDDPVMLLGTKRGPYPLRDLMRGPKTVSLADGEERRITVSVVLPPDATPGGLYGSAIFTPVGRTGNGNVTLDSRIGVLFFVKVEGETLSQGALSDFSYEGGRVVFGKPAESVATLRFENTGTVHLSPYGVLDVDPLLSSSTALTIDPWFVLPKSARTRDLKIGDAFSYGPNTLSLTLHSGYGDETATRSLTIWVFPSLRALGIALALFVVALLLVLRRGRTIHV